MAYAFVQDTSANQSGGASLSAGSITVTAGNCLVIAAVANGNVQPTFSGNSNTYNYVGFSPSLGVHFCYVLNANSGATNVNVTGGNTNYSGIYVAEYSGIASASALLGSPLNSQAGGKPGGGAGHPANGIQTGTTAVTVVGGALVWGFMFDFAGNSDGTNTNGTSPLSFTGRTNCWPLLGGGGTKNAGFPQDCRVTTSGSYGATWTSSSGNQFDSFADGALILAESTTNLTAQTITSSPGTIGAQVTIPQFSFLDSFTEGTLGTPQLAVPLGGQTASFVEGGISSAFTFTAQTITSAEGSLSASVSGNASLSLGPINALFVEGTPQFVVGYLLDQNTLTLVGQTAAFSEGSMVVAPTYTFSNQTITSTEGVLDQTSELALSVGSLNITSAEGVITAQAGNSFNANIGAQTIASSEFFAVPPASLSYALTGESITSTEGTITFSNTGAFAIQLGGQVAAFTEGTMIFVPPTPGTGPPLFIPPQLGKPVTTRTFSWAEMAQRAWGSEFRAPDHRIYQFSGGNYKDSTDLGTTGIYSPNLGPQDNP